MWVVFRVTELQLHFPAAQGKKTTLTVSDADKDTNNTKSLKNS